MSNPSTQIAKRIKSAKVVLKVITAEDSKKQVGAEKEGRKGGGGHYCNSGEPSLNHHNEHAKYAQVPTIHMHAMCVMQRRPILKDMQI